MANGVDWSDWFSAMRAAISFKNDKIRNNFQFATLVPPTDVANSDTASSESPEPAAQSHEAAEETGGTEEVGENVKKFFLKNANSSLSRSVHLSNMSQREDRNFNIEF